MLAESQREAVLLVYFGEDVREVGEALDSTVAEVSADSCDGMTRLRSTGGATGLRSCLPPAR